MNLLSDRQGTVRRVYTYVAYRIGPGAAAEEATSDVLAGTAGETTESLIANAKVALDQRFGPSDRDCELVAMHLAGLDTAQIAQLVRFRPEASKVALRRALIRLQPTPESVRPRPEFVERLVGEMSRNRRPSSRRRRRMLEVAVSIVALMAAVPAVGALIDDDNTDAGTQRASRSSADPKPRLAPRNASHARASRRQPVQTRRSDSTAVGPTSRPPSRVNSTTAARQSDQIQAAPPGPKREVGCDRVDQRLGALRARHAQLQGKMLERQIREKVEVFSRLAERYPEPRFARKVLKERTALERRLYAEWKALLARQSREARALEARRNACLG